MRQVNEAGRRLVAEFEGCRLDAYICPAGVPTIGYGRTEGVKMGDTITQEEADRFLQADLNSFAAQVEPLVPSTTTDNEFAAMTSLAFNIGVGGFRGSSVLRLHNVGQRLAAANAFLLWNKAKVGGQLQPLAGLTRRREAEKALYLQGDG